MKIRVLVLLGISIAVAKGADTGAAPWRDAAFRTSDGVTLRYITGGTGRTIVFVPGWTMPAEIWEFQLRHFSRTHKVVALDPRSQGQSEKTSEGNFIERRAKDIDELLQDLGATNVILVGWSLGSREVLQLVDQSGTSRLAGIVLVDDLLWTAPDRDRTGRYERMLEQLLRDRRAFTEGFVRSMFRAPQTPEYLVRIGEASLGTPTPTAYTLVAGAYAFGRDFRPMLVRIDRPLLYVGTPGTRADAEYIRSTVKDSQVEIFERAGHAVFVDEAKGFNDLLDAFAKRLEEGPKTVPRQAPPATPVTRSGFEKTDRFEDQSRGV